MRTRILSSILFFVAIISSCGNHKDTVQQEKEDVKPTSLKEPIPVDTFKRMVARVIDEDDKYYFINDKAEKLLGPYDNALDFENGLAKVQIKGKWGYIDGRGTFIIPARYKALGQFSEGLCPAMLNQQYGYIDMADNMVIKEKFDDAASFSEGLASIIQCFQTGQLGEKKDCRCGFIDNKGNIKIKPQFSGYISGFHEGLAIVTMNNKKSHVYVNTKGEVVINKVNGKNSIRIGGDFKNGVAEVKSGLTPIYINIKGDSIPGFQPEIIENVKFPFYPTREEPQQYYDNDGNLTAHPTRWGFRNDREWLIQPIYKNAWPFHNTF